MSPAPHPPNPAAYTAFNGINEISFDQIEILTRNSKKKIFINQIRYLPKLIRKKINFDLKKIKSKKKKISQI